MASVVEKESERGEGVRRSLESRTHDLYGRKNSGTKVGVLVLGCCRRASTIKLADWDLGGEKERTWSAPSFLLSTLWLRDIGNHSGSVVLVGDELVRFL